MNRTSLSHSENMQEVLVELKVDPRDLIKEPVESLALKLSKSIGFNLDPSYKAIRINPTPLQISHMIRNKKNLDHYIVRGSIDKKQVAELQSDKLVAGVWSDARIKPAGGFCPDVSEEKYIGTVDSVRYYLGIRNLSGANGSGVKIGIVDGGIVSTMADVVSRERLPEGGSIGNVVDGWSPDGSSTGTVSYWNSEGFPHGNMVARDVQIIAPESSIIDIRIATSEGDSARLSHAYQAYKSILDTHPARRPDILVNGWSLYNRDEAPDYATLWDHPFARLVDEIIDLGVIVLFCAGNCGDGCPDRNCGVDIGPSKSILGAAATSRAITVGACAPFGSPSRYLGYSSQGPAVVDIQVSIPDMPGSTFISRQEVQKPDFCGLAHFAGYTRCDSGTSVATATAAGAIALLRQLHPTATPEMIRRAIIGTAQRIDHYTRWINTEGAGIINTGQAHSVLRGGL